MPQSPEPPVKQRLRLVRRRIMAAVLATFVAAWLAVAALGKGGASSTAPTSGSPATGTSSQSGDDTGSAQSGQDAGDDGLGSSQGDGSSTGGANSGSSQAPASRAAPSPPGSHERARAHRRGVRRTRRAAPPRPRR